MKRDNIFISEDYTKKRVAAVKFVAPGDVPGFDCSIHFGEEGNDVTMQNCIIKNNLIVKCSPDDIYDFETGALIALMKMCGVEKVKKAAKETFFDVAENSVNEYEEEIKKLRDEIVDLDYRKTCNETTIELLYNTINALTGIEDKYKELKEENEKLKLDCEKLQHGYNDMIFCGGRQNGKQHTALVNMFKKLPQDKVDAAYKEAYNTTLPVWQKEVLKQACNIVMDEKEKRNGEQINKLTVDSLIEESRAFTRKCVDEWLYGSPTKREEMWAKILINDKVAIKVRKEDINEFLKELEERNNSIVWGLKKKPTAVFKSRILMKDFHRKDYCYFYIDSKCKITYALMLLDRYKDYTLVDYLPPMRWDLFKKGRLVVKVNSDNYEDFYNKCEAELGRKPLKACEGTFTVYYSKGTFHRRPYNDNIPFVTRVVNWEDVR